MSHMAGPDAQSCIPIPEKACMVYMLILGPKSSNRYACRRTSELCNCRSAWCSNPPGWRSPAYPCHHSSKTATGQQSLNRQRSCRWLKSRMLRPYLRHAPSTWPFLTASSMTCRGQRPSFAQVLPCCQWKSRSVTWSRTLSEASANGMPARFISWARVMPLHLGVLLPSRSLSCSHATRSRSRSS